MTNMKLKEFIEGMFKQNPILAMETAKKLIELESIEQWMNVMWGVELDIEVKPCERHEGRFYGKSLLDKFTLDD